MNNELLATLADVAEELAIEYLAEFSPEDYETGKFFRSLSKAEQLLNEANALVPVLVRGVLRLHREHAMPVN
jgi:hypothetical protein